MDIYGYIYMNTAGYTCTLLSDTLSASSEMLSIKTRAFHQLPI